DHEFANGIAVQLTGNYQHVVVDSSQDYNLSVGNRAGYLPGLSALAATAAGAPPLSTYLRPVASALIPGGPGGPLCTSAAEFSQTGVFGGNGVCGATPLDFDRSNQTQSSWSGELIVSSDWDGAFNFLLGGIYAESSVTENSYFVNSFGLDYASGILGAFTALSNGLPPSYLGSPAFRNNTDDFTLRSYGVFGEAYVQLNDALKLTLGLRYNNDDKEVTARSTLLNFLVPFGTTNIFASPFAATFDADEGRAGAQPFQIRNSQFDEFTGRAVLDWQITPDNLIYASYSRGYKSGGINPPLQAIFAVDEAFRPEIVNAFEIGSKNQFGALQLNLTGFYYQYQDLQLSRIVARTSVNDNVDANIWGLEAEAIITPTRELAINLNASYLNTEVSQDRFLSNPRDPGGGRADAVIIKDITNGSNCAVRSTSGSVAGVNGFVNQTNTLINAGLITGVSAGAGLQPTTAFPTDGGIASRGAFSICQVLTATATAFGASFGGVEVLSAGVPVNIRGNALPQAPTYKFSAGIQYRIETASDISITPRLDIAYTGDSQGSIFNSPINEIDGFTQVNAQINVDGPDRRWYARAFVSNLFNSDSTTGLYVTDQSSGLFTNIFTLEPRRYGVAVGFRF
ncbi:MAG: TonB-dependent receptor, partial [Sphingopyxis sp.]|nr:TonB-dependent receptor [Sphingopyxis sp.]